MNGGYIVLPEGTLKQTETGSELVARKVTTYGDYYVKIKNLTPSKGRIGGGVRTKKHGHSRTSERNLKKYIFSRKMADYVLWLTFPYQVTPQDAVAIGKNFIKKIERQTKVKIACIMKLEPQPETRMCPELCLLIWVGKNDELDKEHVKSEWSKSLKASDCIIDMRRINPDKYAKLVDYFCKTVMFHDNYTIECGSQAYSYTDEMLEEQIEYGYEDECLEGGGDLVRSTQVMNKYKKKVQSWVAEAASTSSQQVLTKRNLFDAWRAYTGSFHFKYHNGIIPKHEPREEIIEAWELKRMMGEVNRYRKKHFVSETQGFSLLGDSAQFVKKLIPSLG